MTSGSGASRLGPVLGWLKTTVNSARFNTAATQGNLAHSRFSAQATSLLVACLHNILRVLNSFLLVFHAGIIQSALFGSPEAEAAKFKVMIQQYLNAALQLEIQILVGQLKVNSVVATGDILEDNICLLFNAI